MIFVTKKSFEVLKNSIVNELINGSMLNVLLVDITQKMKKRIDGLQSDIDAQIMTQTDKANRELCDLLSESNKLLQFLQSERFLDDICDRINRKQIKTVREVEVHK